MRLEVFPVWELSGEAKDLPEGSVRKIQNLAKRIYRILILSGYVRIDLRLDPNRRVYVLEANPNPEIAVGEDFADAAAKAGISYEALLQRLLNLGLRWRPDRLG